MGIDDLDDRRSYVGTTLVYSDRWGPREFWRAGQQVGCVCDPAAGIQCTYHAQAKRDRGEADTPGGRGLAGKPAYLTARLIPDA